MNPERAALVLGPTAPIEEAANRALESAGYHCSTISVAEIQDRIETAGRGPGFTALLGGEPDALLLADGMFCMSGQADEALTLGMSWAFMVCKLSLRSMLRKRFGRIVAVAPPLSGSAVTHESVLGGIGGLIKSVAREVGSRGITANVIAPGYMREPASGLPPFIAAERIGRAEDVASAIRFVAGDGAGYVTGQIISVDGGLTTA